MGMRWMINRRTFEMTDIAREKNFQLGDIEVWEFVNQGMGGMGMSGMAQAHPMHIHGLQLKILDRQVDPAAAGFSRTHVPVSALSRAAPRSSGWGCRGCEAQEPA